MRGVREVPVFGGRAGAALEVAVGVRLGGAPGRDQQQRSRRDALDELGILGDGLSCQQDAQAEERAELREDGQGGTGSPRVCGTAHSPFGDDRAYVVAAGRRAQGDLGTASIRA